MNSIRQRLTRRLLFTLVALIGGGAFTAYLCARAALQSQFDAMLRARADALISLIEQNGERVELESSEEILRDYAEGSPRAFFEFWLADGSPFQHSRSLRDAHLPRPAAAFESPALWNLDLPGDLDGRAVAVKFTPRLGGQTPSTTRQPLLLVVSVSREEIDRTLALLQLVLGGTVLALLAAVALFVPRALRRELQPLDAFAEQARRIDAHTLAARFPAANLPVELTPVATRLNELLARLEESFERERRFSADVAHEFRTPLAELRALAELSLKLPDTRTTETDRDVLAIARHLESVTKCLLALARGERGELAVRRERLNLAPLVEGICRSHQARAAVGQLTLTASVSANLSIESDPVLFSSVLTNLVDNAVAYSKAGTGIEIAASANENSFTLRVINTPENLLPADLPHLFERFWRKDAARTVDGHTGLGLALSRAFARGLDGELTAELSAAGRLTMTFRQ